MLKMPQLGTILYKEVPTVLAKNDPNKMFEASRFKFRFFGIV